MERYGSVSSAERKDLAAKENVIQGGFSYLQHNPFDNTALRTKIKSFGNGYEGMPPRLRHVQRKRFPEPENCLTKNNLVQSEGLRGV